MGKHILIPKESFEYKIKIYYNEKSKVKSYKGFLKCHILYIEIKNKNIDFLYNFRDISLGMRVIIFPDLSLIPNIKCFYNNRTFIHTIVGFSLDRNHGLLYPTDNLSKKEISKLKLLL